MKTKSKKSKIVVSPIDNLPEGCKHLYGTLFMVPFSMIKTPESIDEKDDEYRFENPRGLTDHGSNELADKKLSANLRLSIKNHTLLNPLVCRWVQTDDGFIPLLVGGDRRYRALDYLIQKKEKVSDPRSYDTNEEGEWVYNQCPANEAYALIPCQIFSVNDDLEALALAWAENKNRINLTEGHEIAEVIKLRRTGAGDERILSILQRDEKWLHETDFLIESLDADTLADLLESRIDRASAYELANIEDVDLRSRVRITANDASKSFIDRKIKRIQKEVEEALTEKEIAEANLADSQFQGKQSDIAKATIAVREAGTKVERVVAKRNSAKPVTTSKDIKKAAAEHDIDRSARRSVKKVATSGLEYIDELIIKNGQCPEGTFSVAVNELKLVKNIILNILDGNEDFSETIRTYGTPIDFGVAVIADEEEDSLDPFGLAHSEEEDSEEEEEEDSEESEEEDEEEDSEEEDEEEDSEDEVDAESDD